MKTIITIIFVLTFIFVYQANSFGQNNSSTHIDFRIKQTLLPDPSPEIEYSYHNGILKINEINWKWKKDYYSKKAKKVYSKKLKVNQIKKIDSILSEIEISKLDTTYSTQMIDGVYWTFLFIKNGENKKVILDNYYLAKLEILIEYLNLQIPEKMRYISFDILGTKERSIIEEKIN